jgi:predicted Rossmann fold nucleotide-binding protein DprA/Smf involved in DNA uptake
LDALLSQTGWETPDLLNGLTLMELAGQIVCQADGRYLRRR